MNFSRLGDKDKTSNAAAMLQERQDAQDAAIAEMEATRKRLDAKHKLGISPAGTHEGFGSSFAPVPNAYSQGRPLPLGFAPTRYNQPQSAPIPKIPPHPSSATRVRAPTMGFDDPKSSSSSFADLLTPVGTTVVRSPGGLGGKSHRRRAKKAKRSRKARRSSRRRQRRRYTS